MEITEFMLWKALIIVVAAFIYGIWQGITRR